MNTKWIGINTKNIRNINESDRNDKNTKYNTKQYETNTDYKYEIESTNTKNIRKKYFRISEKVSLEHH